MRPSGRQQFNNLHNEALHHLAIRGIHTGPENASVLLHKSLQNFLDGGVFEKDTDDIAYNIRSLVQFFINKNNFEQARKYLCIADGIASKNKTKVDENQMKSRFIFSKLEYFVSLLKASVMKLQERKRVLIHSRKEDTLNDQFSFDRNSRKMIAEFENNYPVTAGRDWKETSVLFTAGKKEFDFALKYFDLIEKRAEHVSIKQMLSKMYKSLTAFQYEKIASIEAVEKLAKLQRRRVQCLQTCLAVLKCPEDTIQIQELSFELTDVYLDLLELKQKKFERTAGNLEPRLLQKMVRYIV